MKRFLLAALIVAIFAPLADARPFRRTKAVAKTSSGVGGTKAKAKVKSGRIRRISVDTTPEQAVKSAAPGEERWTDWDRNSKRDQAGQGRQNDDLR